jgi:trimethylamine--corrinoid protein Co-methyltransferase
METACVDTVRGTEHKQRRGGRAARRGAREGVRPPQLPFIRRNVGVYTLLDEEGLALIEHNADTILQEIGMEFRDDPEVLDIFRDAGADVRGERVRFERGMARAIIQATTPARFEQHARNPRRTVTVGGDNSLFCPSFGPPFVHDMDRGRRYAVLQDFEDLTRLHHMLPAVHHSGGVVCEPQDVPVPERHLRMVAAHLKLNDKPFMGAVTSPARAEDTVAMAKIVFGSDFVSQNCCIYSVSNSNAPLVLDATMVGALKVYARHNQAVVVSPFILAGAMSPVTVAGTLAQLLAEAMAGLSLVQLIRPGAPGVFGTFSSPISLQTGAPTFGTPEGMQIQFCAAALARRLGVPFHSVGALTASKVPDAQAAYESAMQIQAAFLAGVNFIIHATGCLEGLLTTGYEKTILDADRCAALQAFAAGVDLSEEAQALDAIAEVGPGQHFLGCDHTQRNFETAFWRSSTSDNSTYEQWKAAGSQWSHERANAAWKQMLKDYERPPMDEGVEEALDAFIARRLEAIAATGA